MKNESAKRNGAIDFWRFIFAILVVLRHLRLLPPFFYVHGDEYRWLEGYTIAVEFFFIVSGYLLARPPKNPSLPLGKAFFDFMWGKYKSIFPAYLFAYIFAVTLSSYTGGGNPLKLIACSVYELLFLQVTGISHYNGGVYFAIYGGWYISAMFIGMAVIFPLLYAKRDIFLNIIAPITAIGIFAYMSHTYGKINDTMYLNAILRGISEMLTGCIVYNICEKIKKVNVTVLFSLLLTGAEFACYGCIIVCGSFMQRSDLDFVAILILALGIGISFSGKSYSVKIFSHNIFSTLGKLSLAVYLIHGRWIILFQWLNLPLSLTETAILVFALTFASAFLCISLIDVLKLRFNGKWGQRIKALFIKQTPQT